MVNFNNIVQLIKKLELESPQLSGRYVNGTFVVSDAEKLEFIKSIQLDFEDDVVSFTPAPSSVGENILVKIQSDRDSYQIVNNIDDLLNNVKHRTKEPSTPYYLLDDAYVSTDKAEANSSVSQYRAVIRIFKALEQAALFFDKNASTHTLHLIKDNAKFSIPIKYGLADFHPDLEAYAEKLELFIGNNDVHHKQRLQIIAEVVCEKTEDTDEADRFAHIIREVTDIVQTVENCYALFTSDFKYSKIKDDFSLAKIDFTKKINDVLTGIQGQTIALPIGLIAVFTQLKTVDKILSNQFAINFVVLLCAFGITLLFNKLITNQNAVLTNIEEEVKRQDKLLKDKHAAINKEFIPLVDSLKNRVDSQNKVLTLLKRVVWGAFSISLFYFLMQFSYIRELTKLIITYC